LTRIQSMDKTAIFLFSTITSFTKCRFSETLKPLVISLLVIALLHFTPTAQLLDFYSLPPYPSTKIPTLSPYYSNTGRPAKYQVEILRSLIAMVHLKTYSITRWVKKLKVEKYLSVLKESSLCSSLKSLLSLLTRWG